MSFKIYCVTCVCNKTLQKLVGPAPGHVGICFHIKFYQKLYEREFVSAKEKIV